MEIASLFRIRTIVDFTHISAQLSSSPLTALPVLFIAGVLTSLAPCIYPMIPITAAIVGGSAVGEAPRARSQTIFLTFAYVLGLSLAYASVGLFAGLTGTLFGSVTATDITELLWQSQKVRVDRRKLELPESIKRIGRYQIPVELFADVTATLRVAVVPEGGELPPQEELDAIAAAEAEAEAASEAEAQAQHEEAEAEIEAVVADEEAEPEPESEPAAEAEQVPEDAFDRAADSADPERE